MANRTDKPQFVPLVESHTLEGDVDRAAGVIKNVKIAGHESKWGYTYSPAALKSAAPLYEGKPVNFNHPKREEIEKGKIGFRETDDRAGIVKNVRYIEGQGLYADYHALTTHPTNDRVFEDAEKKLGAFGFSHVAVGDRQKRNGKLIVESIQHVASVDLVSDPATTTSLFESYAPLLESCDSVCTSLRWSLESELCEVFRSAELTAAEKKTRMGAIVDLYGDVKATIKSKLGTEAPAMSVESIAPAAKAEADPKQVVLAEGGAAAAPETKAAVSSAGEATKPDGASGSALLAEAKPALETVAKEDVFAVLGLFEAAKVDPKAALVEGCLALPADKRKAFVEALPTAPTKALPAGATGSIVRSATVLAEGGAPPQTKFDREKPGEALRKLRIAR